ncbi:MAG: LysM peptidoglycan-binding domain-containing protein [Phycisphaerales bacterium]
MTRELKLSLIIGFALVVVVAMLFSDYMSKANRSDLDTKLASQPQLTHPAPQEPVVTLTGRESTEPFGGMPSAMPGMTGQASPVGEVGPTTPTTAAAPTPSGPVEIVQSREPRSGGIEDAVRKLGGSISNGEIHVPAAAGTSMPTEPQGKGAKSNTLSPDQAPMSILPPGERGPAGLSSGITKPSTTVTPAPLLPHEVLPSKADQTYTVVDGDSAYVIAKKFYGNGEQWKKIQAANPGRMGANGEVRVGVSLKIPEAGTVATKATPIKADKPVVEASKPVAAPVPGRTYTVKKGDSLQLIATKQLKSASRADEILKLNSDQLKDADLIRVGMVLKLPAK